MNRRTRKICIILVSILVISAIAYAITSYFFTTSQTSNLQKVHVFQFDLSSNMQETEVGPGDSFSVSPTVVNDSTEEMYVFIKVDMPTCNNTGIYTFDLGNDWILVSDSEESKVYAYASTNMITLAPGESTSALTDSMTMDSISYADYSNIDDINVTITGYAIGTEDVSTTPSEAWMVCKALGSIE